jgi:hypothetical protein
LWRGKPMPPPMKMSTWQSLLILYNYRRMSETMPLRVMEVRRLEEEESPRKYREWRVLLYLNFILFKLYGWIILFLFLLPYS